MFHAEYTLGRSRTITHEFIRASSAGIGAWRFELIRINTGALNHFRRAAGELSIRFCVPQIVEGGWADSLRSKTEFPR